MPEISNQSRLVDGAPRPQAPTSQVSQASNLTKRVQALITNDKFLESIPNNCFEHLSKLIADNSISTRKNLRNVLENELVSLHMRFAGEYEAKVTSHLDAKLADMEKLESRLTDSIDKLSINRERMGAVIDKSVSIKMDSETIQHKLDLIDRFSDLFVIDSGLSERLIETGDFPSLLQLLDDIESKRRNCQVLLSAIPNSVVAIESLNRSVELLEFVYERLYFAISKSNHLTTDQVRRSLLHLQDRPHYFHQALVGLCQTRCDALSAQFITVLTRGEDGLELNSFDSIRFLSDMLGWLLDAALTEYDWINSVTTGAMESMWTSTEPVQAKQEYLDVCFSGVLEMIESRYANMVKGTFGILDLFKLSKIVSFYLGKMGPYAGSSTQAILSDMKESSWSEFLTQWENRVQNERSSASLLFQSVISSGLGPLPFVKETAFLLDNILAIFADEDTTTSLSRDDELFSVLSSGTNPIVQLCVQVASQWGLSKVESAVFLLNCLSILQAPLRKYDFTVETVKNLAALIDDRTEFLVAATTEAVLKKVGLMDKLTALRAAKDVPASDIPELHPISLSSCFKAFYAMLFTQGISAASHTDLLITRELRAETRYAISKGIADAYEELYAAVSDVGIATHTPDQVRALLDIY